jgi:hypothetical protein
LNNQTRVTTKPITEQSITQTLVTDFDAPIANQLRQSMPHPMKLGIRLVVAHPDVQTKDGECILPTASASSRPALIAPNPSRRRPSDDLAQSGPPANPIDFPRPAFERGRHDDVLCHDESAKSHDVARGVLFQDFSKEHGDADGALHRVKQAHWPLPHKEKSLPSWGMWKHASS